MTTRQAFEEWARTPPPENWWSVSEAERIRMTWQAATAAALERAMELCDKHRRSWPLMGQETADTIKDAIRALKDETA